MKTQQAVHTKECENSGQRSCYCDRSLKPSHTPWTYTNASGKHRGAVWIKSGDKFVGKTYSHDGEDAIANAAYIVKCVNAHEELLELVKFHRNEHRGYRGRLLSIEESQRIADKIIAKVEGK